MAVDTAAKRMSCIGVALPVPSVLPIPDGDIGDYNRISLVWLYSGIAVVSDALVLSANVAIRLLASATAAIRVTATGDVEL